MVNFVLLYIKQVIKYLLKKQKSHKITFTGSSAKKPIPNGLNKLNMIPDFPTFPALNFSGFLGSNTFVVTFSTLCPITSGFLFLPILICFVTVVTVLNPPFVSVFVSDSVLMPFSSFLLSFVVLGMSALRPMPKPSGAVLRRVCWADSCFS